MTTYKNSFPTGPREYTTDATPETYGGYLIYKRFEAVAAVDVYDIVKDGVCVSQYAGPNGARGAIDNLNRDSRTNCEFKIVWSENNLRYLAGEPDSDRKTRCVKVNRDGIEEATAELETLNSYKKD